MFSSPSLVLWPWINGRDKEGAPQPGQATWIDQENGTSGQDGKRILGRLFW